MRFSDEIICSALVSTGSIRRAADALGCSVQLIRQRLQNPAFQKLYQQHKDEILTTATDLMKSNLSAAVCTLSAVMDDVNVPPQTRVSAADALLRHSVRYIEMGELTARIEALETAQKEY